MHIERQGLFWAAVAIVTLCAIALLKEILLPFVAGTGIAYFLSPVADWMENKGLPRVWASALIVLLATLVFALLLIFLLPLLVNQVRQFAVSLPGQLDSLQAMLEGWARERLGDQFAAFKAGLERATASLSENWSSAAGTVAQSLWSSGSALINFLSLLLVTPVVVFYLLVDWHPMMARIDGWLPREHAPTIRKVASDINDAISAFVHGQGMICLILGVFYALGLTLIGIKYGLLIGLATGLLGFVPFVGWAGGLLISSIVALTQGWPDTLPLIKVIGLFGLGQALDAGFLSPKIVGTKIGLHPVWLIFALFVFSYLFGFVGVLVAVPLAAAAGVLVRFALDVYLHSDVYDKDAVEGDKKPKADGASTKGAQS